MTVAQDARLTDEQKKAREEKEKQHAALLAQLRKDFNETFSTSAGIRTLRWIMDQSGYQRSNLVADPTNGEIAPYSSLHNEGRRVFYLQIRNKLSKDILSKVELEDAPSEIDIFS